MRATTMLAVMILGAATPQISGAQVSGAQSAPVVPPNAVVFRNTLPGTYRLVRVRLLVDGIAKVDQATPFDYRLPPGDHAVDVEATFRLDDPLFTYMRDYVVELRSMNIVVRKQSRPVTVVAIARERGNATTPLSKRAIIHWQTVRF